MIRRYRVAAILGTLDVMPWWAFYIDILGLAWCILAPFLLYRNEWVRVKSNKLIKEDMEDFMRLPSYNMMLAQFWIWDIKKFKRKDK